MAETFFGVSMIPMNYKDEVRQMKSELLCFLGHRKETHLIKDPYIDIYVFNTEACQWSKVCVNDKNVWFKKNKNHLVPDPPLLF